MRRYHLLLVKYEPDSNWAVEFGDYDRKTVSDEMAELSGVHLKRLVTVDSDDQAAIDAYVDEFNRNWRR